MDAHNSKDDIAFFARDLGFTQVIAAGVAASQRADAEGPLEPGAYLVHIANLVGATTVWIKTGKFGTVIPVTAAVPSFPMSPSTVSQREFVVVKGYNDQVAAITDAGTANVYLTKVSRGL
jgi:hypothetical protein